ncbi:uncharacterized protein Polr1E [Prorops nasuta]|uniref:uncharacterized protein Polr1E n=1 Tax=Prorops nasuta TaxID=863751 RepID=UPI0034CFBAE2
MATLIKAIIEDVIIEPDKIQPIIVNFQNGQLKDEEAEKMECDLFYDEQKKEQLLALSNGQIVYQGYKPIESNELMQTMLVVHNKRTGKVRLLKAERWQVSPVLHKFQSNVESDVDSDKLAMLNKQFGSKKAKRKTEQYEKMKVNVNSIKEQLEKTVENIDVKRVDLSISLPVDEYITNTTLPTCNRDAQELTEVYNPNEIVPEEKLNTLYDAAKQALEGDHKGRSQFFIKTIKFLKSDPDKIRKTAMLLYIDYTVNWLNVLIKDAKKRYVEVCPESTEINTHIIDSYSIMSISGRTRPNSMKDKGIIHCMVLALIICKFSLNLESFASTLGGRISMKKLTELARVILAMPNKDDKKIVSLKLPLPQPLSMARRGKKKL